MDEIEQLIDRLKEGEEDAFRSIYEFFEVPLYHHLSLMLGSREKSEEAFQETMLKVIKKIDFYKPNKTLKNSFKAWVFRIGTNTAIDIIRKEKLSTKISPSSELSSKDEVETKNLNERISHLISELPPIQRTVLNLKVNEDLSHFEISAICGCSVNTVKQGLFRARRSLKGILEKEGIVS